MSCNRGESGSWGAHGWDQPSLRARRVLLEGYPESWEERGNQKGKEKRGKKEGCPRQSPAYAEVQRRESMLPSGNWHKMEAWVRGVARSKAEGAFKARALMGLECQGREPWEGLSRQGPWSDLPIPPTPAWAIRPLLLNRWKLLSTPRLSSNLSTGSECVNFLKQADLSSLCACGNCLKPHLPGVERKAPELGSKLPHHFLTLWIRSKWLRCSEFQFPPFSNCYNNSTCIVTSGWGNNIEHTEILVCKKNVAFLFSVTYLNFARNFHPACGTVRGRRRGREQRVCACLASAVKYSSFLV